MFQKTPESLRLTLRALAHLLGYPDAALRANAPALLDALRLMHALRPDGITWRQREDGGGTSFKLEHLAEDNGLRIGDAHEALSDVRATIGLARLFRQHQPRLWDYALRLRNKRFAASMLDTTAMSPLRPEPPPPDSLWESFFSFLRRVSVVWV